MFRLTDSYMENKIQNENALLDAFEIEKLEERLEMAPWSDPPPPPRKVDDERMKELIFN